MKLVQASDMPTDSRPPRITHRSHASGTMVDPDLAAEIAAAWRSLTGSAIDERDIGQRQSGPRCRVFALPGASRTGDTIIAKEADRERARHEVRAYREVLPWVSGPTITLWGLVPRAGTTRSWLFLSDAGTRRYDAAQQDHRRIAAQWLGAAQVRTADVDIRDVPERSLNLFANALTQVANWVSAAAPGAVDGRVRERMACLGAVIAETAALWPGFESVISRVPMVVSHGDFIAKNLRLSPSGDLLAFDWEAWGKSPATFDLAESSLGFDGSIREPEVECYLQIVRSRWPWLSQDDVAMGTLIGAICWYLAALDLETAAIAGEPEQLLDSRFDEYISSLSRLVDRARGAR